MARKKYKPEEIVAKLGRWKVPQGQPKKGRLWFNDGSCIRLRPEHRNHVWSYAFVEDRTHDGRKFRMLNVIDGQASGERRERRRDPRAAR